MYKLPIEKSKKPTKSAEKKAGRYIGFKKLVSELKNKGIDTLDLEKSIDKISEEEITELEKAVQNPAALAAYIGRKKYGKKRYQKMAVEGKKKCL